VIAGFAQGLAAIPGISRSGSTLAALLGEGFPLSEAFRLSFLMSIPAVLGVELALPLLKGGFVFSMPLVVGSIFSAVVGFATIDALLKVAARSDFYKVTMVLGALIALLGILLLSN
jgi:undecaprenyl-diphosphatase